ncbi:hypothetical protein D3C80_2034450 [compost metagenome]
MGEQALLGLHVGDHLVHEMRLIDPREAQAEAIRALIQAKRHRHRRGALHLTVAAGFAEVLEQHIAAQ